MLALDGLIGAFAVCARCRPRSCSSRCSTTPTGDTLAMVVTVAYPGRRHHPDRPAGRDARARRLDALARLGCCSPPASSRSRSPTGSTTRRSPPGPTPSGGLLDYGWPIATLLIGSPPGSRSRRARRAADMGWRQLIAPGAFAAVALGVAAYAYAAQANPFAMGLACASGIAVIVRMVATFRENLVILDEARREAVTDALTGLGNRRRLLADLELRIGGGAARARARRPQRLQALQRHLRPPCRRRAAQPPRRAGSRRRPAGTAARTAWAATSSACCSTAPSAAVEASELVADALTEQRRGLRRRRVLRHGRAARARPPTRSRRCGSPTRACTSASAPGARARRTQGVALLLRLLAERDPELGDHVSDVAELAVAVAERLELPPPSATTSAVAAALHDIGKLAIPDSILGKPGPLDDDEWSFMRRHTLIGERILGADARPGRRRRARAREPRAARRHGLPRPAGRRRASRSARASSRSATRTTR